MDHSTLHKPIFKKRESETNKNGQKVKRRSFAQKQKRDLILDRQRNMSPLKERNKRTAVDNRTARKERLKVWKEERKKKKELDKLKAKPVFKVSSVVKRDDKLLASSKEKKASKEAPVRNTRSRKGLTDMKKEAKKQINKVTRENKPVKVPPKTKQDKSAAAKNKENKEQVQKLESNMKEVDPPPLSESFAPRDFRFKPPTGLERFRFDSTLPNSNESFISKGGDMNFISSTPRLPNALAKTKTAVPMVFSSASASSSDENSEAVTAIKIGQPSINTDKEERKTSEHSTSFKILSQSGEKGEKVQYFRNLISTETENLTSSCNKWEKVQEEERESLSEEVVGEVRTVIGQAQLLMAERFVQFGGLVDKYENPKPDHNPVTPADLKGFWEMIYFQVEDVVNKFKNLESLKEKNWQKVSESTKRVTRKRKASTKATKCSSAHRRAARQRIKEAREAMKLRQVQILKQGNAENGNERTSEESSRGEVNGKQPDETFSSQDEGVMTRSRRKTPGGKNVSFVTPRSKKRKARFTVDETNNDPDSTPLGSLPRKRVMRKTPRPGSKPESAYQKEGELSCHDEDVQASPTLMRHIAPPTLEPRILNEQDEIKGMKLNFDDVESDGEEDDVMAKYLLPSVADSDPVRRSSIGLDNKYLLPSESDSLTPHDSLSDDQLPTKSLGRVLRSSRKSYHNPISPFLAKNVDPGARQQAEDLMSFSPFPLK